VNLNPLTWNWNEQKAAGRHVLNTAGSVLATLAAVHLFTGLTPDVAASVTDNLNTIYDSVIKIVTAVGGIAAALAPVYAALTAKKSAEPAEQVKSVVASLSAPAITQAANAVADPASRNKLISAVAEMPEVRAIVAPEAVAQATDSNKVVSTPAAAAGLPLANERVTI
jgi:hypothetical protein